jgi:hypothetical protein
MTTTSAVTGTPTLTLRHSADLVAAVPYLLGFHPDHSVVLLVFRDRTLACASRGDLPGLPGLPGEPGRPGVAAAPEPVACQLVTVALRQNATAVAVLAYGPAAAADATVAAVRTAAERRGLVVRDALRVDAGRWWSYVCDDPRCCPPDGTPFDPAASDISATCTYHGLPARASRAEVARQVAAPTGPALDAIVRATGGAWTRLSARLDPLPDGPAAAALRDDGAEAVTQAVARYTAGGRLDDDEVAWLTVLLTSIPVRDAAWLEVRDTAEQVRLWLDVTRRAEPELAPAPASLLAFAAWRAGDGTLAAVALERALHEDPGYSMAKLLRHGLAQGLPPSVFDRWGATDPAGPDRPLR